MKKHAFFALLLALIFITLTSSPTLAANTQAAYAKISPDLISAFAESNGRLQVVAWLEDKSTEEYQAIVSNISEPVFPEDDNASAYSLQNIEASELPDEQHMMQIEQMQNYIMQKREIAQAVYLADNNVVAQKFESELNGGEIVYISRYSSLIVLNISLSEAVDIAMCSEVNYLEYDNNVMEADLSHSLPAVDAMPTSSFPQYSAAGIKIGMIEPYVPDTSRPCFDGVRNKIVTSGDVAVYDTHASFVAAIIVNAAPDFERLYCYGNSDNLFYENVEALLTAGVNVINMSAHITTDAANSYNSNSKWIDHIAYNHSVHFVKSSGNNAADGVSATGMAYNAIVVGNVNDMNTSTTVDDTLFQTSSYNATFDEMAFKPDICAPGAGLDIPNDSGFFFWHAIEGYTDYESQAGTSFSAPHVTAIVAALCSYKPQLMTKQALMKSILMNSVATKTAHRYDTTDVFGDDSGYRKYGAGIVNAYNAKLQIDSGNYINTSMSASATTVKHNIGTLQAGQTVSITLVFLKRVRIRSGSHENNPSLSESELPRINLHVGYADAPAHVMYLKSNDSNYNNVQRIIFTAPATDEYEITLVKLGGDSTYETIYAVSWMVDNNNLQ